MIVYWCGKHLSAFLFQGNKWLQLQYIVLCWESATSEHGREVEALGNGWVTSAFEGRAKTCRGILDRSIKSYY